ncbi:MAG: hypothetical protein IKU32_02210 [Clostridia bacterium]|nr:hypothetical protein [Clostridia bacterium]
MKYALIENGVVTNTIALLPYNAQDFPNAIDTGERPVQIGDTFDGEKFYRNGKEVHTEIEEKDITIDRLNTAGAEAMQSLNAEPPVSAGVFTYGEWMPDTWYERYALFTYNGVAGFIRQAHTSLEVYPPFSVGTEALYGARPSPDTEGIYPYVYNMRVEVGMRVRSEKDGNVYIAIQPADPLLFDPADAVSIFVLA